MADLSQLSDEELAAIASGSTPAAPNSNLAELSDEDLARVAYGIEETPEPKGFLQTVGDALSMYGSAPSRAAFSELTRTSPEFAKEPPSVFGNIAAAGKAFANQFGEDPSLAPTGEEIAEKRLGLSNAPKNASASFLAAKGGIAPESGVTPEQITKNKGTTPAMAVGAGLDLALDPLNILPVGAVAKGVGRAGEAVGKTIGRFSLEAAKRVPGGKATIEGTSKLINTFTNPKRADDFAELASIAEKNGIDLADAPEAIEFGKDSLISRASRVSAEGPLGQPRIEKFQKFMGDTTEAFDSKLSQISGTAPLSRVDAGVHLRQAADRAVEDLFETVGEATYGKIAKANPGVALNPEAAKDIASKLDEIESFAQGKLKRGLSDVDKSQARGLLNAVAAIRRGDGSLAATVEELQAIGKAAYKPQNTLAAIPPDIQKLRELYGSLREGVFKTVEKDIAGGEALVKELKEANELMSSFFGSEQKIGDILGNSRLAPEQVFDRLTKNTDQINALRNLLRPEDFAQVKGAYLDSLLKRDELGNISWKQLRNSLSSRQNQAVIGALFDPSELKELVDIAKLGERAGIPIMSTSGTGASNSIMGTIKDLPSRMGLESLIDAQKNRARGLQLPKEAVGAAKTPIRLGPAGISAREAVGLRLPQQISIKENNKKKDR